MEDLDLEFRLNFTQVQPHNLLNFTIGIVSLGDEVGLHTWTASLTLAEFVLENSQKFKNKNVLELGAGSAVPSIIAGMITEITATDATEVINLHKI